MDNAIAEKKSSSYVTSKHCLSEVWDIPAWMYIYYSEYHLGLWKSLLSYNTLCKTGSHRHTCQVSRISRVTHAFFLRRYQLSRVHLYFFFAPSALTNQSTLTFPPYSFFKPMPLPAKILEAVCGNSNYPADEPGQLPKFWIPSYLNHNSIIVPDGEGVVTWNSRATTE
jgi:hypothetical protein